MFEIQKGGEPIPNSDGDHKGRAMVLTLGRFSLAFVPTTEFAHPHWLKRYWGSYYPYTQCAAPGTVDYFFLWFRFRIWAK